MMKPVQPNVIRMYINYIHEAGPVSPVTRGEEVVHRPGEGFPERGGSFPGGKRFSWGWRGRGFPGGRRLSRGDDGECFRR